MEHYLKVCLHFERDGTYVKYDVVDGGWEKPSVPYEIYRSTRKKGANKKIFAIYVEDAGKPFDLYAEEALNAYQKWTEEDPSHRIFERKVRSDCRDRSRWVESKKS